MTREQKCKEFTELNGGHWHEVSWVNPNGPMFSGHYQCLTCQAGSHFRDNVKIANPTYSRPEEVLAVMMKRKDWFVENWHEPEGFCWEIGSGGLTVDIAYITVKDKLFNAAHQWCAEHKEG